MNNSIINRFTVINNSIDLDIFYVKIKSSKIYCIKYNKNNREFNFHKSYLKMARVWSSNSYAKRRKVGALIVKDKMIISDGFNGSPIGFPNICEDEEGNTFKYVLHAEANAITKIAKSSNSCKDSDLYITASPCLECSKLIIQSGIKRIYFSSLYRDLSSLELLNRANIEIFYIPNP